jgi:hypothetical protein
MQMHFHHVVDQRKELFNTSDTHSAHHHHNHLRQVSGHQFALITSAIAFIQAKGDG